MDEFLDKMTEECGVVGIYNNDDAVNNTALGLHALQHRGSESSGIVVSDSNKRLKLFKKMGLVSSLVKKLKKIKKFKGNIAIGHNRYSTTGANNLVNAQPILIDFKRGQLACAHNGNLVNANEMRLQMEEDGSIFQSTNDSEVILHLIAKSKADTVVDMIEDALKQLKGAFSILFMTNDTLIAARDPMGVRPLALGKLDKSTVVASETCAFDIMKAHYTRDIEPGEMVIINKDGITSRRIGEKSKLGQCIFEYIYFSRPDSIVFGHSCDKIRRKIGKQLAIEQPADADIVIAVPDSSNTHALGYASESGIPFEIGLLRNHYVGRTFIAPNQSDREMKVRLKFSPIKGVIRGKKIVLVDDSLVRGTTIKRLIPILKEAGAVEIHVRISSPPVNYPCYYGMDFPTSSELIASTNTVEQIQNYLGVESLGYISIMGLKECAPDGSDNYCCACFDGLYPGEITKEVNKVNFTNK